MCSQVSITGHQSSIVIEVFGYENPSSLNASDANWLKCHVVATVGQFTGNYDASFTASDFVRFGNELKIILSAMSGSASFETDEEALKFRIEMKKTGTAQIQGLAQIRGQPKAALSFAFESDQSFLAKTLHDVECVTQKYPVKSSNT